MTKRTSPKAIVFLSIILLFISFNSTAGCFVYQNTKKHYSFTLPDDWKEIPQDLIKQQVQAVNQYAGGMQDINFVAGFQRKFEADFSYPYILVQEHKADSVTYNEMLKAFDQVKPIVKSKLEGYSELIRNASFDDPFVDRERGIIFMNVNVDVAQVGTIKGLVAMFLGKKSIVQLNCYAAEYNFSDYAPLFDEIIDSFKFDSWFGYLGKNFNKGEKSELLSFPEKVVVGGIVGLILFLMILFVFLSRKLYTYEQ